MLTWAIVYAVKSGIELPGVFLLLAIAADFGMVAMIAGALGGAWR